MIGDQNDVIGHVNPYERKKIVNTELPKALLVLAFAISSGSVSRPLS
ncbi:hypothetical protein XAP6164_1010003 [Xanthomonas phaseoli pv. phaseoli]|nr:hypothetical protein XAP6164_1010003 [Xanthomonas phaseoli pv. phaseoli]